MATVKQEDRRRSDQPVQVGERATDDATLTTTEVSERLGISTGSVLVEIQANRLQAFRIRRDRQPVLYRVSEADLQTYLRRAVWDREEAAG